jgi:uncharacterized membrane protein
MSVKSSLPPLNWLHQFFWADGRMHDLGVTGYSDSYLNGRGQIATTMLTPKHRWFAFVWENGIASDLSGGRWSYADGINDRGQIVGSRSTGGSSHGYRVFHAVLWTHTPG